MNMKVYKPILSSIVLASLASCSSVANLHKLAVPPAIDNAVNITEKRKALTEFEENNWHHLDLATDSIPGMSVRKAYTFLKGKKGTGIVRTSTAAVPRQQPQFYYYCASNDKSTPELPSRIRIEMVTPIQALAQT